MSILGCVNTCVPLLMTSQILEIVPNTSLNLVGIDCLICLFHKIIYGFKEERYSEVAVNAMQFFGLY